MLSSSISFFNNIDSSIIFLHLRSLLQIHFFTISFLIKSCSNLARLKKKSECDNIYFRTLEIFTIKTILYQLKYVSSSMLTQTFLVLYRIFIHHMILIPDLEFECFSSSIYQRYSFDRYSYYLQ